MLTVSIETEEQTLMTIISMATVTMVLPITRRRVERFRVRQQSHRTLTL